MARITREFCSASIAGLLLFVFSASLLAKAQEPPPAPQSNEKAKKVLGFLIIGTVFNENAISFPGLNIRVRRSNETKYRWQTVTNSRGEFALRVPDGQEYEVEVRAKHYKDQTLHVNTNNGDTQQRLSIKMEPLSAAPAGAKP